MTGLSQTEFKFLESFNEIAKRIHEWALLKGFWESTTYEAARQDPLRFASKIALVHSEVSEALEADRKPGTMDQHLPHRDGREVELADAVIRIMDLAHAYGFNLGEAILEKMAFNSNRPFRHNKEY